jgi:hypothetical protein
MFAFGGKADIACPHPPQRITPSVWRPQTLTRFDTDQCQSRLQVHLFLKTGSVQFVSEYFPFQEKIGGVKCVGKLSW